MATADPSLQQPYIHRGARLKAFFVTSLLSVISALILFVFVVQVDMMDGAWLAFLKAVAWFKPVMALAAASPLFAALLIGYGYMSRAMKRREREAALEAEASNPA